VLQKKSTTQLDSHAQNSEKRTTRLKLETKNGNGNKTLQTVQKWRIYDSFTKAERIIYILASRTERELRPSGPY